MTGQPLLTALLGANAKVTMQAAFGADLSDADGSGWTWTDISGDVRHDPGAATTVGRTDNVGQAGAARIGFVLNNQAGAYTPGNPTGVNYPNVVQNTPIRQLLTLDGTTQRTRFQGYADSFNPVYVDPSGKVRGMAVTALGMLGRLAGRKKPLRSALTRAIIASSPTAHWPMEDAAGSTQAASAVAGVGPLVVSTHLPVFGGAGPGGAAAAVDFGQGNSGIRNISLPVSSATSWRIELSVLFPDTDAYIFPIGFDVLGDISDIDLQMSSTGINVHTEFQDGSTARNDAASADANDGLWHRIRFDVTKSGSNTLYALTLDGTSILSLTLTGVAFGHPSTMSMGSTVGTLSSGSRIAATACALWQPVPASSDTFDANDGWTGETADDRLTRLCAEENVDLALSGTSTVTMGPQSVDTIVNLLRECEAADHGMLYDGLGPGIGYQCRTDRYDQTATLTLDMGADPPEVAPPFTPIFDRQAVKNLYAVSRKGGSTATYERTSGPLGTDTIGVEDAATTINTDDDAPLIFHAGWLVTLGTIDGFRFPAVAMNMRGIPGKADDVLAFAAITPGWRLTIQNPATAATDMPPDPIDLIVEGWTETITADSWTIALNCSPYAPYRVLVLGTDRLAAGDSSTLSGDRTATASSLSVNIAAGKPLWTTDPTQFPMDINIGGERITLSAISGITSPQTFTASARSVNGVVKAHTAGEIVEVWQPATLGL